MKSNLKAILQKAGFFVLLAFLVYACARPGMPGGGYYDVDPPRFVRSYPEPEATNFKGNKIELYFDEYLSVDNPSQNVIITPPQLEMPNINAVGKKISIELKDSTKANTTYSFAFGNSIRDNNEKNALEGFSFAFSTGDVIDSLIVSGLVMSANELEPMSNILVGLHSNLNDTAFTNETFVRTSITDEQGQFQIRNIAPGTYRLFAVEDNNRNYKYDFPEEQIAFADSLIIPSFEPAVRMDTLWRDSLTIEEIKEVHYTRFTPDDIVLRLFKDDIDLQYTGRPERPAANQVMLNFNSPVTFTPELVLLDSDSTELGVYDWYLQETTDKKKLTYWITDSTVYQRDTLFVQTNYMEHDTLYHLVPASMINRLIFRDRSQNQKEKKKNDDEPEKIDFLGVNLSKSGSVNITDSLYIVFSEPVDLENDKVLLQQKVDTLWEARSFALIQDSLNPRAYYIEYPWNYDQEFTVLIDSAAITGIYGKWNDEFSSRFKFGKDTDYGDLYVKITGNKTQGFGELITAQGKLVKTSPLYNGELIFENLQPQVYYLRYIEDENKDGKWTTGLFSENRQPEVVHYYHQKFDIRKLVSLQQNWNLNELPATEQKPDDIKKTKSKEKTSNREGLIQKNEEIRQRLEKRSSKKENKEE